MKSYIIPVISLSLASVSLSSCGSDEKETPADVPVATAPVTVQVASCEYNPMPGQFINELPRWSNGLDAAQMNSLAADAINRNVVISLGAFGGSVTMKLDKSIVNVSSHTDFIVTGNAFAGSAEPGVVEVSQDGTTWYALRGEYWDNSSMYTVTYYRPQSSATDEQYIRWTGSDGRAGWISRNSAYHTQPFFPQWLPAGENLTITARRLPDNGSLNSVTGRYILRSYAGYADSFSNSDEQAWLDIDNAVDASGNPVSLSYISYIRVTTGVLQNNGALGECSTEVGSVMAYKVM